MARQKSAGSPWSWHHIRSWGHLNFQVLLELYIQGEDNTIGEIKGRCNSYKVDKSNCIDLPLVYNKGTNYESRDLQ